jgi:hypothetical protein
MATMTWTTVGAIVLLAWLAVATGILVVVFVRRLRAKGLPEPTGNAAPYLSILEGPTPRVPPPEWVNWEESPDDERSAKPPD